MITIQPYDYISEKYVMRYFYYTKAEAIKKYKTLFPQFKTKELLITKF
jgi:hypothetical protein